MSEETENKGFFGQLKTQIIGGVGILLTGLGTMFLDEVKGVLGIADEEPTEVTAPAQSNQQSVNVSGPAITINVPEQKAQPTQTIIREVPAEPVPAVRPEAHQSLRSQPDSARSYPIRCLK